MASFNINTFSTTAQTLANTEFGYVGQSGSVSTTGAEAVSAAGAFEITVLGTLATNGDEAIQATAATSATIITGENESIISSDIDAIRIVASTSLTVLNAGLISGRESAID